MSELIDLRPPEQQTDLPLPYEKILFTEEEVTARIGDMAAEIRHRYRSDDPLFVCLLRGANPFASQLMFSIAEQDMYFHPEMDYMAIVTYGKSRIPRPPKIKFGLAPSTRVEDRPVVIIDDILDTGVSAARAESYMEERNATSVDLVVLAQKVKDEQRQRKNWSQATIFGFETEDRWITGYGMDDARQGDEANRWLKCIALARDVSPEAVTRRNSIVGRLSQLIRPALGNV